MVESRSVKRNAKNARGLGRDRAAIFPAATAPFPKSCTSYFRFARFNMFPLYYLRAWHRLPGISPLFLRLQLYRRTLWYFAKFISIFSNYDKNITIRIRKPYSPFKITRRVTMFSAFFKNSCVESCRCL